VNERCQPVEIFAGAIGLRQDIAHLQNEASFERYQLALLSGEYLFQARPGLKDFAAALTAQLPRQMSPSS